MVNMDGFGNYYVGYYNVGNYYVDYSLAKSRFLIIEMVIFNIGFIDIYKKQELFCWLEKYYI